MKQIIPPILEIYRFFVNNSRLSIALIGILLTLPIIIFGFPDTHSTIYNASWMSGFADQFYSGELYPRWLKDMNNGWGSPVFFFYGPVPFYISAISAWIIPFNLSVWHLLAIGASAMLIGSGLTAYSWFSHITDRYVAFPAALLYMVLPYHLKIDLYTRGAIGEFCAFIWLPLIFHQTHKVAYGKTYAIAGLSLSYGLLILSHLPTALLATPYIFLYACITIYAK